MEYKIIKRHCNAVEMCVALLGKEWHENFVKSLTIYSQKPEFKEIQDYCKVGYVTLTLARDIYRKLGYEIEISPIVNIKDECYLSGKYRWMYAHYNQPAKRKDQLVYTTDSFSSYDEALNDALVYIIKKELDMKTSQTETIHKNVVDEFTNELKQNLNSFKAEINNNMESVKSVINDFETSEVKKEMENTINACTEKGKSFGKTFLNACKAFSKAFK